MQKCRASSKSVTSGKKTSAAVLRIVKALGRDMSKRGFGTFAAKEGRSLRRRVSDDLPAATWSQATRSAKLAQLEEASESGGPPVSRRQRIMAKYGVRDPALPLADSKGEVVVSDSDDEPVVVPASEDDEDIPVLEDDHDAEPRTEVAVGEGTPPFVQFLDSREATLVRVYKASGEKVKAKMVPGACGFLQAWFGAEGPIDTEVPNLNHEAAGEVKKRPAGSQREARASMTEASGSSSVPERPTGESTAQVAQPPPPTLARPGRYIVLLYKRDGGIGLRRCFGDRKQVWSVRCKAMESAALRALVEEAKDAVEQGRMSEQAAKDWVKGRLPQ